LTTAADRAKDPALKDKVSRLIQFLKDLVTARAVPVRQVSQHLDHLWLNDVRDLAALEPEAGTGQVLLRLPRVLLEPAPSLPDVLHGWISVTDRDNSSLTAPPLRSEGPSRAGVVVSLDERPDVTTAYEGWLPEWQRWAEHDRPQRLLHLTYDRLRSMRQRTLENPESMEVVLAGGLLQLPAFGVRTHVVTHRALVDIEAGTGDVVVVLDGTAVTGLEDGRILTGLDCFDDGGTAVLRARIAELDVRPTSDNALTFLKEWADRALLNPVEVTEGWGVPPVQGAYLSPTPAIVLRQRGAYALQEYYNNIERTLSDEGESVPLGLAQLVEAIEADDRVAWLEATGATAGVDIADDPLFPLAANEEQAQIIGRLRNDTGVVVEGPPGTGKTHTIANLMSALLARGQRVLVTSEKAQALKVLREKLPEEMQELCVSMTDVGRGGSMELSRSVSRLAAEHSSFNAAKSQRTIDDLAGKLSQARGRRAGVLENIRALRESETYQHPEVAAGYAGTLARIAESVAGNAIQYSWLPLPAEGQLPVSATEFDELRRILPGDTEMRRRRRDQVLPQAAALPEMGVVQRLAGDVARGAAARASQSGGLSEVLGQLDGPTLVALIRLCSELREGLTALSTGVDASWSMQALEGVIRGDNPVLWQQVGAARQLVQDALAMNQEIGFADVTVPADVPLAHASQVFAGLARYLHEGGTLRKLFKSDQQKAAEPYLSGALVDGQKVQTAAQAHLVMLHLSALARLQAFAQATALLQIPGGTSGPRAAQVSYADRVVRTIASIENLRLARDRMRSQLGSIPTMPHVDLATTVGLRSFVDVASVFADVEVARRATDELQRLAQDVELLVESDKRPPELDAAILALRDADAGLYVVARDDLEVARRQQREQQRCDELCDRLDGAGAPLLRMLRAAVDDLAWDQRIPQLEPAWNWACAATVVRAFTATGMEQKLDRELAAVDGDLAKLTAELAAAPAWKACLERMNATQVMALQSYRDSMANVGKGTGKYAQRYRAAAREAMTVAQGAVPAWVMPLQEVLASIPPEQNAFDVVIVDEASQVGIENLFLLWLAPRVIVVGDDKQCTPSEVKHGALDRVFDRLDTLLPDMPSYLRATLTPRSSVFSTLRTRFGQVIRLREHFRCMPEIITWSSQMFYRDAPLVPVRQHGADRLQPLKTTYVPGAYTEGANASLRNVVEAESIVDAVVACLDDPAYAEKTLGVIVLQGQAQVDVVREALFQRVDAEEWERRKLRIGTPPDFQGDERDVVFLSLVTAPDHKRAAQTRMDAQRSYNVAASRARDQLWLFHSVAADQLKPGDLRSQLLTYMASKPVAAAADMPADVTENERHLSFDSLFEQRVFLHIRQRGYHVTPQVEVNGRRIDLVVTGAQGKLAVECDGDAWHSSPEQVASDFARELELRRCGWQFWRIRESRYYLDPEESLADLWLTLDKRGIGPVRIDAGAAEDWIPGQLSPEEGVDLDPGGDVDDGGTEPSGVVPVPRAPLPLDSSDVGRPVAANASTASVPLRSTTQSPLVPAEAASLTPNTDLPRSAPISGFSAAGGGPNRPVSLVDDETTQSVLELAADGSLTNEIVRRFLDVSSEEARRVLSDLVQQGLLEKRGATKGTHYVLVTSGETSGLSTGPVLDDEAPVIADVPEVELSAGVGRDAPVAEGPPPVQASTGLGEAADAVPSSSRLDELEVAFEARVLGSLDKTERSLNPWWLDNLETRGALEFARYLLARSEPLMSLRTLSNRGLLHYSIEATVLDPVFASLFSKEEVRVAEARLDSLGFFEDEE
jgi:very-short-patch-repair endonuclease